MTKYKYPSEGLYNLNRNSLDVSKNNITGIIRLSTFSVPSSFAYRKYVLSLSEKFDSMKKELDVIERLIKRTDDESKNISEELAGSVNSIVRYNMHERNRMII